MRTIHFLAVNLALLAACSHAKPAPVSAATTPAAAEASPPPSPPAPPPVPAAQPEQPPVLPGSIYFNYDNSELSPESRAALQLFFEQAIQRPDQAARIEGNCDDRGTAEYNLALGQRRAGAAKKYLEDLGLEPSRISTISYGKERPRAAGDDEVARRENRRDDLIPTPGTAAVSAAEAGR
jgi:peptidoglycan-associated lipoprotein